ncbi:transglycosylase domain-containing protein [Marilutibacter chinensis]|uniref:Transglycosylase domain-containing protein n=1 Tax=Marilutibacter chinensis TaxID=2912247 RepID=A0ABS9HPK9_9GAMM|nr:transglycosylase domain-containing protein [Lysobacter chinensis]MCF7220543.1 transglycosylase domain-containing protein [Lysobacter chinensis]
MSGVVGNAARALALLIGLPALVLFAYDIAAVRPHLGRIEAVLAAADPEDAAPPERVREMIDHETGGPELSIARMVAHLLRPHDRSGWRHLHEAMLVWLLPLHLDESQIYGLYCALSYNGTGRGLNDFAEREFGKPLSRLSPKQAATTVAITRAPSFYLRDREGLDRRARRLPEASGRMPE